MREAIVELAKSDPSGTAKCTSSRSAEQQPLERRFAMSKGQGKDSYSKNSSMQASLVDLVLPALDTALGRVVLPAQGPVSVVDLGSSSGPNTIGSVAVIIEKLRARYLDPALPPPEFQAFFNDLPSNDFNNLFQLLNSDSRGNFFTAGVPGSFYGRLFPRSSVHVFFSALSAHWLSKVPEAVLDKHSPAYNKDKVWINGASLATGTAYKEQAATDLKEFLHARAAELVPGGLVFLVALGRSTLEPNNQMEGSILESLLSSVHETCWSKLISEGIITEEHRATFNFPLYYRNCEEIMEALESCDSAFDVVVAELASFDINYLCAYQTTDPEDLSEKLTSSVRPVFSSLLDEHVGKEAATLYWHHFHKEIQKNVVAKIMANPEGSHVTFEVQVLSLVRK